MCGLINTILFILCLITILHVGIVNGLPCCDAIPESATDCREVCSRLYATDSQAEQLSILATSPSHCPHNLIELWDCAERSVPVLLELGTFSGRICCNYTKTKACREACINARSESDIENQCSRSMEDAKLYNCISRLKDSEKCCGSAVSTTGIKSDSQMCKATCLIMYVTDTLTKSDSKRQLRQHCTGRNKNIAQCPLKQTRPTRQSRPSDNLLCCENTRNQTCKRVCQETLKSEVEQESKIDKVISACGEVNLMDPLYQCFLKKDNSEPKNIVGLDAAKLHCCQKASSTLCGSLCVMTHKWKWSSIHKFEQHCGYVSLPVTILETNMLSCIKDVEEPCQLGCSGLEFCAAMNNRPNEHFRSCNAEADNAAKKDILLWQNGTISLPSLSIPVKDIRTCEPEMWKAIACAYQIKPCYRKPAPPQICQEDCVYIINKCVDRSRLDGQMVTDVCNRLPLAGSGECISVKHYTSESPFRMMQQEITTPCNPSPCGKGEICLLHRRKCRHSASCPHFVCRKACKLGQVSKVLVPQNTHVLIPVFHTDAISQTCQHYKVCHCSHMGNIGNCHAIPCVQKNQCSSSAGNVESNGDHFRVDCNDCVCFGGETSCTKRQCNMPQTGNSKQLTGILNCPCSRKYEPVCATNGKTYPSSCVARCAGEAVFSKGTCFDHNPCKNNPCEKNYQCVPHRQVCLTNEISPCIQYKCVDISFCNRHHHEPVCDMHGQEYTNDCILLAKGASLAYRGHCVTRPCSSSGLVCGQNGETYINECTAIAARTTVDYLGACKTFGYISDDQPSNQKCEDVECKRVNPAGCKGIIPPWSCCPVCAAELRILLSERLVADVTAARRKGPITLSNILETLSTMVSVSECDIFGYLSLDGDIIVLVAPIAQNPTALQVNACMKEAERFSYLIQSRSPMFISNMLLTPFLYAPLRTPAMTLTSGAVIYTQPYLVTLTLFILIHFTNKRLGLV